jgi:hypothetical protein
LGQHKHFKAERGNSLTAEDKKAAEEAMKNILETKVPGIDY